MKNRNLKHSDNWQTPTAFYERLNKEFNFDFDPCPINTGEITDEIDGLKINWGGCNFVNPPYSRKLKEAFIWKAIDEFRKGKCCVMLLPVSTSTEIFHGAILNNITEPIRFVKSRIKFIKHNDDGTTESKGAGMHDSMIVIFDGRKNKKV